MSLSASRRSAPARILLLRTSALGDIVHALPALAALRRSFPRAKIGWAVDEAFAPLLDGHALLDELFVLPLRRWRHGAGRPTRALLAAIARLRRFAPDVAIDLMGNHKGALLALLSGARLRLGAARSDRREPASALWLNRLVPLRAAHAVDRGLELLSALDIETLPVDFAPEALAGGRGEPPESDYIYLHPGAAWGNKRYPPASWAQVARELGRSTGLPVLVGVAPGEEELARTVVAASAGAARELAAPTLPALVAAVRNARLVLAGDTGAAHLARALGRPLLAVHGPTDPERHGPWSDPGAVVFRRLQCSFCHRRMDEAKACLLGVTPAEIVEKARARLAFSAV